MESYNTAIILEIMADLSISKERAERLLTKMKGTYGVFCPDTGMDLEAFTGLMNHFFEGLSDNTVKLLYKEITGFDIVINGEE